MSELLAAAVPFVVLFLGVFITRSLAPAIIGGVVAALFTSLYFWQMSFLGLLLAAGRTLGKTLDLAILILGALLFLEIMKTTKHLASLELLLGHLTTDPRVHIVLLAGPFAMLMEGIAGFGTPIIFLAPLLYHLGIPAYSAIILSLLGTAIAAPFGAIGSPLLIGLASSSVSTLPAFAQTTLLVALISSLFVLLGPLLLSATATRIGPTKSWKKGLEIAPFSLLLGVSMTCMWIATAVLFGPAYPAITTGIVGIIVGCSIAKQGWGLPHKDKIPAKRPTTHLNILLAGFGGVLLLLLIQRIPSIAALLTGWSWDIANAVSLGYVATPFLLSPGWALAIAAGILAWHQKLSLKSLRFAEHHVFKNSVTLLPLLAGMLFFVELLLASSINPRGFTSIPTTFGGIFIGFAQPMIALLLPFIGGLFAAAVGNATLANLVTVPIVAQLTTLHPVLSNTLITMGAAWGSILAFPVIILASSLVGVHHHEGLLLRKTAAIVLPVLCVIGLLGVLLLFVW